MNWQNAAPVCYSFAPVDSIRGDVDIIAPVVVLCALAQFRRGVGRVGQQEAEARGSKQAKQRNAMQMPNPMQNRLWWFEMMSELIGGSS